MYNKSLHFKEYVYNWRNMTHCVGMPCFLLYLREQAWAHPVGTSLCSCAPGSMMICVYLVLILSTCHTRVVLQGIIHVCNFAYGELGRFSLFVGRFFRIIKYWFKIILTKLNKLPLSTTTHCKQSSTNYLLVQQHVVNKAQQTIS